MSRAIFFISWTILLNLSRGIKVPPSWNDEQAFLPYYVVVDGLPSDKNVQTYYPAATSNDQVVQNDVVVKLFQKMNPHLQVLESGVGSKVEKADEGLRTNYNQEKKPTIKKKHHQHYEVKHKEQPRKLIHPEEEIDHSQYHHIEDDKYKPDPHVVREGLRFYDEQKTQLQKQFPSINGFHPSNGPPTRPHEDSTESFSFEPYRTYAQVRQSVTKKRIPKKKKSDPRLKESIKDSKVHTVYSEEGYEDSGYDHGEQEKSAESNVDQKGRSVDDERHVESREYQKNDSGEEDAPQSPPPPAEEDFEDESAEEESESRIEENRNVTTENPAQSETKIVSTEKPENTEDLILIDSYMDETNHGENIALKRHKRNADKYPLYNYKKLNQLSSLRYIENSDDVPIESVDDSFYEKADKIQCPEVADIDPIPERIRKTDQNTTTLNETKMGAPKIKLNKLGDQIDCLKSRYFGEEPLDNPLFAEDGVETPKTIFNNQDNEVDYDGRSGKVLDDGNQNATDEVLPEAEAYILRRLYRRPPQRYFQKDKDRRKRPRPHRKDLHPNPSSTERFSEVHYKDEIKPSEQMNVFADIINNIKNSSKDLGVGSSEVQPVSIRGSNFQENPPKREYHSPKVGSLDPEFIEDIKDLRKIIRSTTAKPRRFYTPRYRKYNRRPVTSTASPEIQTEYVAVKKRRKIHPDDGFKPMLDADPLSNHKLTHQEIEPTTLNLYYVIGMQPPPEKSFVHPNFYSTNHVKQRKVQYPTRRRFVRSTRRGYAEIERGRQRVESTTTEKIEEDDYRPHRRRNFHYDEKTGKIIYDKQPQNEEIEEVEYEYVEVEEPTHPPPKSKQETRRIWPSKFPDGPNYLDFVKKLKEDKTYVQILDPKSTEKPIESTTAPPVDVKSEKPLGIPEYLALLDKLRNNKEYKFIEEPAQKTRNTTATFEKERIDFEDDIDDEIEGDVQNSPGAQVLNYKEADDGADVDSEGKTKNYNPRTGVDTSKYKSIERKPVTRHNISSKYSADEDETTPTGSSTTTSETITIDAPTTSKPSTIPLEIVTTTKNKILAGRRRSTTTPRVTTSETTTTPSTIRRRNRSRFRSTTTERIEDQAPRSRRNLQRTHQSNLAVPRNHKAQYDEVRGALKIQPTPRTITLDLIRQTGVDTTTAKDHPVVTTTKDVEVFKEYDKGDKHGGNYKYRKLQVKVRRTGKPRVEEKDEKVEIRTEQYYDTIPKPFDYYTDPKLPQKVNRLKVKNVEGLDEGIFEDQTQKAEFEDFGDLFRDTKKHTSKSRSIEQTDNRKDSVPAFIKDPSLRLYYYAPI